MSSPNVPDRLSPRNLSVSVANGSRSAGPPAWGDAARHALSVLEQTFGSDRVEELAHPAMASEDFSYVLDEVPGAFVFLGATPAGTDPEEAEMNHSPRAVFDDGVLGDQAAALAALALSHVGSTR